MRKNFRIYVFVIQYNGKEGAHGYYEFGTIQQQDTPRLSSATALRNAVAADDRDLFGQAAGVDPNTLVAPDIAV